MNRQSSTWTQAGDRAYKKGWDDHLHLSCCTGTHLRGLCLVFHLVVISENIFVCVCFCEGLKLCFRHISQETWYDQAPNRNVFKEVFCPFNSLFTWFMVPGSWCKVAWEEAEEGQAHWTLVQTGWLYQPFSLQMHTNWIIKCTTYIFWGLPSVTWENTVCLICIDWNMP